MTRYHSTRKRSFRALSMALGLAGLFLVPCQAIANDAEPEALRWARVDFLRNRVQLLPAADSARRAQISDILRIGDSLRTMRRSRAELRFNDDSLARIGERATFRFTPNTRNFQLTNGTVLLLIPPGKGRSTIQTPNAVTGIQGSALFVRYIPETDTTIVGALTNNPDGPMVLFNRDGSEQQALQANEIGVIEGDQITELYRFDSELFWESSGLAEGFDYEQDASPTGDDALDGVRQEIREAVSKQAPLPSDGAGVIENPSSFSRPDSEASSSGPEGNVDATDSSAPENGGGNTDSSTSDESGRELQTGSEDDSGNRDDSGTTTESETPETSTESGRGAGAGAALTDAPSETETPTGDTSNGSAVSQPTSDVLEPVPGAAPVGESVEDAVLDGELAEIEEPVVELEFEGTPAETYLAAPPVEVPSQPLTNGGNKLVPTAPVQSAEENVADDANAEASTGQDEAADPIETDPIESAVPTPVDEALGNSPVDNRDGVDGISRPVTQGDQQDPTVTEDTATEENPTPPAPPAPGSPAPTIEVIVEPPATEPTIEVIIEPPASELPTEPPTDPPTDPPAAPPVDTAPVLPESNQNPDAPLLLDSGVVPDTAVPVIPPDSPALDPSTDLVPVRIEDAGGRNTPVEVVIPETPAELVQPEAVVVPESSSPVQSPEPVIEAVPDDVPGIPAPIPPTIEDFDSGVPFDEPEVGGVSLEETLEPVDLPVPLPEPADNPSAEPRSLIDNPINPTDNVPAENPVGSPGENPIVPQPQPAEPVDERVLL